MKLKASASLHHIISFIKYGYSNYSLDVCYMCVLIKGKTWSSCVNNFHECNSALPISQPLGEVKLDHSAYYKYQMRSLGCQDVRQHCAFALLSLL